MPSQLTHIAELKAHSDFLRILKASLEKGDGKKFHYFEKFRFGDGKTLPLLIVGGDFRGQLEKDVLERASGSHVSGVCKKGTNDRLHFLCKMGTMKPAQLTAAVKGSNFKDEVVVGLGDEKPEVEAEAGKKDDGGGKRQDKGKEKEFPKDRGRDDDEEKEKETEERGRKGDEPGTPRGGRKPSLRDQRTKVGDLLPSKPLGEKFRDEDKKTGKWRAAEEQGLTAEGDGHTTHYFDEEEQRQGTVDVGKDGLLRDAEGQLLQGKKTFAVDPKDGSLHAKKQAERKIVEGKAIDEHHSSHLAGRDVAAAGNIVVDEGFAQVIDDDSGHYKGEADLTSAAVGHLRDEKKMKMIDDRLASPTGKVLPKRGEERYSGRGDGTAPEVHDREEAEELRRESLDEADRIEKARKKLLAKELERLEAEVREKGSPEVLDALKELDAQLKAAHEKEDVELEKRILEARRKRIAAASSGVSEQVLKRAAELAREAAELRSKAAEIAAPANRETNVQLQGKGPLPEKPLDRLKKGGGPKQEKEKESEGEEGAQGAGAGSTGAEGGVTEEEYLEARGDGNDFKGFRRKLNVFLKKRYGVDDLIPESAKKKDLDGLEQAKKYIGTLRRLSVPASKLVQSEGDEDQLRRSQQVNDAIRGTGKVTEQPEIDFEKKKKDWEEEKRTGAPKRPIQEAVRAAEEEVAALRQGEFRKVLESNSVNPDEVPGEVLRELFKDSWLLRDAWKKWPSQRTIDSHRKRLGESEVDSTRITDLDVRKYIAEEISLDDLQRKYPVEPTNYGGLGST